MIIGIVDLVEIANLLKRLLWLFLILADLIYNVRKSRLIGDLILKLTLVVRVQDLGLRRARLGTQVLVILKQIKVKHVLCQQVFVSHDENVTRESILQVQIIVSKNLLFMVHEALEWQIAFHQPVIIQLDINRRLLRKINVEA